MMEVALLGTSTFRASRHREHDVISILFCKTVCSARIEEAGRCTYQGALKHRDFRNTKAERRSERCLCRFGVATRETSQLTVKGKGQAKRKEARCLQALFQLLRLVASTNSWHLRFAT